MVGGYLFEQDYFVLLPLLAVPVLIVGIRILSLACSLVSVPPPGWKKGTVVVVVLVLVNVLSGLGTAYVIETVRTAKKKAVAVDKKGGAKSADSAQQTSKNGQPPEGISEPEEAIDPLNTFRPLTFFRGLILFLVYLPVNAAVCLLLLKTSFLDGIFISLLNLLLGTLIYFLYSALLIVLSIFRLL